jgi:hypothetical protein
MDVILIGVIVFACGLGAGYGLGYRTGARFIHGLLIEWDKIIGAAKAVESDVAKV